MKLPTTYSLAIFIKQSQFYKTKVKKNKANLVSSQVYKKYKNECWNSIFNLNKRLDFSLSIYY